MTFGQRAPFKKQSQLRSYRIMNDANLAGRPGYRPVATSIALLVALALLTACGGGKSESSDNAAAVTGDAPPVVSVSTPEPELESPAAPTPAPLPTPTGSAVPGLPPSQQLPSDVDVSRPGVAVKAAAATSSATENDTNSAAKAIDGDPTTRWSSAKDDGAWIQFDFGAKTALGYMKLVWENAYGKEYALQGSDDGHTWYQLRYVVDGKGGTEEFFNLNANVRYLRMQGVARATQFGYSLFEVEFKSPGSDNSLPVLATSAVPYPADGSALAAAPPVKAPLEVVQFSLPDGTLVTRFGMVGRSRHARERGEGWNEIGYG